MQNTQLSLGAAIAILALANFNASAQVGTTPTSDGKPEVTFYGRVDLGVFSQDSGTTPINAGNGLTGSAADRSEVKQGSAGRLGVRGTSAIDQDLSLGFLLEHRFQPDSGVAETPFYQARSFIELESKALGSLYIGREYIPAFWVGLRLDPWGFDTVGTPGPKHQLVNYTIDGGIRSNNTVGYKTPSFGGLTGTFAVTAGEGLRKEGFGGSVEYRTGPWYAGIAIDHVSDQQNLSVAGLAYDFKTFRPSLILGRSVVAGNENKNYTLAATAPFGKGVFKVAVAVLDLAGPDNDNTRASFGYEHRLNKYASWYADIARASQNGTIAGKSLTPTMLFDAGLKLNF